MASAIVRSRTTSMACDYPPREELNTRRRMLLSRRISVVRLRNDVDQRQVVARNQERSCSIDIEKGCIKGEQNRG